MRYSGLLTLVAATAEGLLDQAAAHLVGNTAGGWAWSVEENGGVVEAVVGRKTFGSGAEAVERGLWLCGDAAGTSPGLLNQDTFAANRVYVGGGVIAPGSYAWQGWKNAAPIGVGGIGRVHALVGAATAGHAAKLELWLAEQELAGRVEGSTSSTARVFRVGAICTALVSGRGGGGTGDADGRRTGGWVSGHTNAIGAGWVNGAYGASVYAVHQSGALTSHGWMTRNGAVVFAEKRAGCWAKNDTLFIDGKIRKVMSTWHTDTGRNLGWDTGEIGGVVHSSAGKVYSEGGVEKVWVMCRDSSASSTEAIGISAELLTP